MEEKLTLRKYCEEKGITTEKFSKMTGVSRSYLDIIKDKRDANITVDVCRKIYHATEKEFGEPLDVWQYCERDILNNL